jgi:hypothetical protein
MLLQRLRYFGQSMTTFNDISKKGSVPEAKSSTLQFYSANRNIGNYTPVLGIQDMLGKNLDTWNIHRKPVDWDFVHRNYQSVIVGGAGLLHKIFEDFWHDLDQHCRLPIVVWGVGVCLPHNDGPGGVSRPVVQRVFERSIISNVRDELTRDFYELDENIDISMCPTIHFIASKYQVAAKKGEVKKILHSHHSELEPESTTPFIKSLIQGQNWSYSFTKNVESEKNILPSILQRYRDCDAVITTRLHGAIIAYSYQRPYIALSFDPKIDAFSSLYGGGGLVRSIEELHERLQAPLNFDLSKYALELSKVRQFGVRASLELETS